MSQVVAGAGETTPSPPPFPGVTEPEEECSSPNGNVQESKSVQDGQKEEPEPRKEPGWFSRRVIAPTFRRFMRRREVPGVVDDQVHPMKSCPRLYISSICAALNWKALEEAGITHILALGPHQLPKRILACFRGSLVYSVRVFPDDPSYALIDVLGDCLSFIRRSLLQSSNNRILVHCNAGHSRSATVCCAFLMQEYKYSVDRALDDLRETRPLAKPNAGFIKQLREMEDWLLEQH